MQDAQPKFKNISYRKILKLVDTESSTRDTKLLQQIRESRVSPSVILDCWSSQNNTTYPGSTIHFVAENKLLRYVVSYEFPSPHTSIGTRNSFKEQLDRFTIKTFKVFTDNAANMKAAFAVSVAEKIDEGVELSRVSEQIIVEDTIVEVGDLSFCGNDKSVWSCNLHTCFSKGIPTIQKLEMALLAVSTNNAAINVFKDRLIAPLQKRFEYIKSMPFFVVSAVMDPNVKLAFSQNDIKNIERRMFAFQRAETVAHVHQYFDACMPVNVGNENDHLLQKKLDEAGRICSGRP